MKHQSSTETTDSPAIFKLFPEDHFFQIIDDFHRLVARRAYELFSETGFTHGHDLADWLHAESEILKPVPFEISEIDDVITVKASLPGYDAKDIEIHVEPRRLFVSGQQQEKSEEKKRKSLHSVQQLEEIFNCVDLSAPIDPDKVTATLDKSELRVELTKASPAKKIAVAKAAA